MVLPLLELRRVVVLVGDDDPELVLGGVGTTVLEDAGGSAVLSLDRDSVNALLLPESTIMLQVQFFCFSKKNDLSELLILIRVNIIEGFWNTMYPFNLLTQFD